jgi:hypothetical protein
MIIYKNSEINLFLITNDPILFDIDNQIEQNVKSIFYHRLSLF